MLTSRLLLRRSFTISHRVLSGHNKWSKIKQKKGANDAQKGAIFGKASRDIVIAVRNGGSVDPDKNTALAAVLKRAKMIGVPKDNIENALSKASGGRDKGNQILKYEALAFNSVGVIVECLTDNPNRTNRTIRAIISSHDARSTPVGFMFERKGCVRVVLDKGEDFKSQLEVLIDAGLSAGAEDFDELPSEDDSSTEIKFTCEPDKLVKLTAAMKPSAGQELLVSELIFVPKEFEEPKEEVGMKVAEFVEALEENEDTLRVWTSIDT